MRAWHTAWQTAIQDPHRWMHPASVDCRYASKWLAAADAAGYALCVAVGQFDPDGALVPGTERFVHNPTPWNGSGNPGQTGVSSRWINPKQGQPTNCHVWNGTSFVRDTVQRFATVSSPAPIDQTDFNVSWGAVGRQPRQSAALLVWWPACCMGSTRVRGMSTCWG